MDRLARYQRVLGVEPGTSPEEIKRAYRRLMKRWHPDVVDDDPRLKEEAERRAKEINAAYEGLRAHWSERAGRPPEAARPQDAEPPPRTEGPGSAQAPPSGGPEGPRPRSRTGPEGARRSGWIGIAVVLLVLRLNSAETRDLLRPYFPPTGSGGRWFGVSEIATEPTRCFTVGSSEAEVRAVQGEPTVRASWVWGYGSSRIYFVSGRVAAWYNTAAHPLRAGLTGCGP